MLVPNISPPAVTNYTRYVKGLIDTNNRKRTVLRLTSENEKRRAQQNKLLEDCIRDYVLTLVKVIRKEEEVTKKLKAVRDMNGYNVLDDKRNTGRKKWGFSGSTMSLYWWQRKGSNDAMSYKEFKRNVKQMAKDTSEKARAERWAFTALIVLADWHHSYYQGNGTWKGYNGKDYHVHILTYGTPTQAPIRFMCDWWQRHRMGHLNYKGKKLDAMQGDIELKWNVDFGWYKYLLANLNGSTKGIGDVIAFDSLSWNRNGRKRIPRWLLDSGMVFDEKFLDDNLAIIMKRLGIVFDNEPWAADDLRWSLCMSDMGTFKKKDKEGYVEPGIYFDEFNENNSQG